MNIKNIHQSFFQVRHWHRFATGFVVLAVPALIGLRLKNPLGEDNPDKIIADVIEAVLGVVGALALLFFVYGGVMMLISAGNPERIQKGRDTLMWATVGLIVVFGSYGIVQAIFLAIS